MKPTSFDLEVTIRCNSSCRFCSFWKNKTSDLKLQYIHKYIRGISRWMTDSVQLNIVGGEPTVRDDLREILLICRQENVHGVVTTNGYRLADYGYAKSLISTGMRLIVISLEGFQKTNDYLRGEGSFNKTIHAIKNIRNLNNKISIVIQSVINAKNIAEIPDFISWLYDMNYVDKITFQVLCNDFGPFGLDNREWWLGNELWPQDLSLLNKTMDQLSFLNQNNKSWVMGNPPDQFLFWKKYFQNPTQFRNPKECNVGDFFISCLQNGEIRICPFLPPVGNIKNNNVKAIFYSALAQERRKSIALCKKACNFQINCRYDQLVEEVETDIAKIMTNLRQLATDIDRLSLDIEYYEKSIS